MKFPDKVLMTVGTVSAFCCGAFQPAVSIFMGEILAVYDPTNPNSDMIG